MDLAVIALAAPNTAPDSGSRPDTVTPQTLTDILWANTTPDDRVEHITVKSGLDPGAYTVAMFLLPTPNDSTASGRVALRVCLRAVDASPALRRWSVRDAAWTPYQLRGEQP